MNSDQNLQVCILDYGLGNLFSVERALRFLGVTDIKIGSSAEDLLSPDLLIIPGVGAFGEGMKELRKRNLISAVSAYRESGRPILGICLGMQLLFSESEEFGLHEGLNLIHGKVISFAHAGLTMGKNKIPHYGWTKIALNRESDHRVNMGMQDGMSFYFVHSFVCVPEDSRNVFAYSRYGDCCFASMVKRENIYGCQFHPEKSGKTGLLFINELLKTARFQKHSFKYAEKEEGYGRKVQVSKE